VGVVLGAIACSSQADDESLQSAGDAVSDGNILNLVDK